MEGHTILVSALLSQSDVSSLTNPSTLSPIFYFNLLHHTTTYKIPSSQRLTTTIRPPNPPPFSSILLERLRSAAPQHKASTSHPSHPSQPPYNQYPNTQAPVPPILICVLGFQHTSRCPSYLSASPRTTFSTVSSQMPVVLPPLSSRLVRSLPHIHRLTSPHNTTLFQRRTSLPYHDVATVSSQRQSNGLPSLRHQRPKKSLSPVSLLTAARSRLTSSSRSLSWASQCRFLP